jgi:hypothetical protein
VPPQLGGLVAIITLVAKFNRQDLINTPTGSSVIFNVTGKYYYDIRLRAVEKLRVTKYGKNQHGV